MRRIRSEHWLVLPLLLFVLAFEVYPILTIAARSLFDAEHGFTLEHYRKILADPVY